MTPAQRALILHALGLTPRDGVMPRWSDGNGYLVWPHPDPEWDDMERAGWVEYRRSNAFRGPVARVTRRGAEAAGVLGRCRREDLGR